MIDKKRIRSTTYRVELRDDGYYNVQVFRKKDNLYSTHPTCGSYRYDVMPEWIKNDMRLLDFAGTDVALLPVGIKADDKLYWLYSEQLNNLIKEGVVSG